MARRRTGVVAALLAAAAVAGGCTGDDVATTPAPTPDGAGGAADASTTAPAPPAPEWEPCGDGLDCAEVEVPVDHADAGGATTTVAIIRHAATDPARRIGVLMTNPGGPGASGVDQVRSGVAPAAPGLAPFFGPELLARFDVVGVDPRGIGASDPIACQTDAEREALLARDGDPDLPGGAPRDVLERDARDLAEACARANDETYLAHLATDDVARDLDLVRAALGEEQISFLGSSYGTLLGVTYAQLFPSAVRAMVLDGPLHPTRWQSDPIGTSDEQTVSAEQQLDRYFETCRAEGPACGFGGGDPAAAFDALVDRLEAEPLVVPAAPPAPEGRVDGATLLFAARTAVFDRTFWPVLTAALVTAEQGDGSTANLLAQALVRDPDGTPSALGEGNYAVNCLDRVRVDDAALDAQAARLPELAPRFGTLSGYGLLGCGPWPVDNPDRYTGPYTGAGAPPVLVVGGELDSQTPLPWAEAMTESLPGAVLLTRTGVGHTSYGGRANGACIDDAVDAYLTTGELPAEGTVCQQEPPATAALTG